MELKPAIELIKPKEKWQNLHERITLLKEKTKDIPEFSSFADFLDFFGDVSPGVLNFYSEGGELNEQIKFVADAELPVHNAREHVAKTVEMCIKMIPGLISSRNISSYDAENLLLAAILHDTGWLLQEQEKEKYPQGAAQKFLVHSQQSIDLVPVFLETFLEKYRNFKKNPEYKFDQQRIQEIQAIISGTEFNPIKSDNISTLILAKVLQNADFLSYFCNPHHIPRNSRGLFRELQVPAPDDPRTRAFIEVLREKEGQDFAEHLKTKLEQGKLLMGELKPDLGKTEDRFIGSAFLSRFFWRSGNGLEFLEDWHGQKGKNPDKDQYLTNIARASSIYDFVEINPNANITNFLDAAEQAAEELSLEAFIASHPRFKDLVDFQGLHKYELDYCGEYENAYLARIQEILSPATPVAAEAQQISTQTPIPT